MQHTTTAHRRLIAMDIIAQVLLSLAIGLSVSLALASLVLVLAQPA
jgi:hypothetical protein